jgi:hypothetical protein
LDWSDPQVASATVRALLIDAGHTPADIDAMPRHEVRRYLAALPTVRALRSPLQSLTD